MATLVNHYKILGVSMGATEAEIRTAYRARIRRYHPDLAPEGMWDSYSVRARELNVARDALLNPAQRRRLDEQLRAHTRPATAPTASSHRPGPQSRSASSETRQASRPRERTARTQNGTTGTYRPAPNTGRPAEATAGGSATAAVALDWGFFEWVFAIGYALYWLVKASIILSIGYTVLVMVWVLANGLWMLGDAAFKALSG